MTASEVSMKGNCVNVRGGESFSSGYSESMDARKTMEGQNGHFTHQAGIRGIISSSISAFLRVLRVLMGFFLPFYVYLGSVSCRENIDPEMALYTELWHACAGPLVTVLREGQRMFYFPQGHIEHVSFLSPIFSYFLSC
ncbi:hypothetical protein E1A91_A12G207600v1 [Gossypium mustelinum]|uniref:Auxin response factor domain-containing protein n=1 Tax=Gossypium mustelinum TaxID=34275 RepID=A0A5D2WWW9_GOSMU|nr:hypothetical protein E1A91_A12G207600v1 [Gossypium mustelinum]